MLRWGLLGAARITRSTTAPALRACGHDLAVVGARSLARARELAAEQGVRRARGSYDDVLAEDVDAVYVALPNDAHERWAVAALEAGKHVLCEKPLALDAGAADRVAAAAAANGRVLLEAVAPRFHPRTAALLDVLGGGEVGDLRHASVTMTVPMRAPDDVRADPARGGGALLDLGVYTAHAAAWLRPSEPVGVGAVQRRWPAGVDAATTALLQYADDSTAVLHAGFDAVRHSAIRVLGTHADLVVPDAFTVGPQAEAVLERSGAVIGRWRVNAYEAMVAAFADAVATGAPTALVPAASVEAAVLLDRVAAAAQVTAGPPR